MSLYPTIFPLETWTRVWVKVCIKLPISDDLEMDSLIEKRTITIINQFNYNKEQKIKTIHNKEVKYI